MPSVNDGEAEFSGFPRWDGGDGRVQGSSGLRRGCARGVAVDSADSRGFVFLPCCKVWISR
jgi:hypothetical protein